MGRMAPNERPVCDVLGEDDYTWEDKALHMLDIVKDYQCMNTFFEKPKLSDDQQSQLCKKFKVEDAQAIPLPPSVQDIYDQVAINNETQVYETYEHFYQDLKATLSFY